MTTTLELEKSVTFKNILVATDFSDASKHAVQCATTITDIHEGQLFVLHVVPPEPRLPVPLEPLPASLDRAYTEGKLNLENLARDPSFSQVHHEEMLKRGPVAEVVLEAIRQKQIDLLVLGTHGRTGLKKIVMGSVAEELFRRAPCPVLTVGPFAVANRKVRRVLFATDFGPSSMQALPYALDFANQTGVELILLHLVPPLPIEYIGPFWYPGNDVVEREDAEKQQSMKKLRNLLPSNYGLKCAVRHVVEVHLPPEGIVNFAKEREVDMIVMGVKESGTSASRLASHMPWAIAHEVVRHAECPVLTVRA